MAALEERIKAYPRDKLEKVFQQSLEKCRSLEAQLQGLRQEQQQLEAAVAVADAAAGKNAASGGGMQEDAAPSDVEPGGPDQALAEQAQAEAQVVLRAEQERLLVEQQRVAEDAERALRDRLAELQQEGADFDRDWAVGSGSECEADGEDAQNETDHVVLREEEAADADVEVHAINQMSIDAVMAEFAEFQGQVAAAQRAVAEQVARAEREAARMREENEAAAQAAAEKGASEKERRAQEAARSSARYEEVERAVVDCQQRLADLSQEIEAATAAAAESEDAAVDAQQKANEPCQEKAPTKKSGEASVKPVDTKAAERVATLEQRKAELEQVLAQKKSQDVPAAERELAETQQKVALAKQVAENRTAGAEAEELRKALSEWEAKKLASLKGLRVSLRELYAASEKFDATQMGQVLEDVSRVFAEWESAVQGCSDPSRPVPAVDADQLGGVAAAVTASFQRLFEAQRERVRQLGTTNKQLQSRLQETKAEGKAVVSEFVESTKDSAQAARDAVANLEGEIEKLKQDLKKETESDKREAEKLKKYDVVIEQAKVKLAGNEKKVLGLKSELAGRQEEHVGLQMELDRVKHAGVDAMGCEVVACVEVEVGALGRGEATGRSTVGAMGKMQAGAATTAGAGSSSGAEDDGTSTSGAAPETAREVWCLLKNANPSTENGTAPTPAAPSLSREELNKRWWRRDRLQALMGSSRSTTTAPFNFPVPVQQQHRLAIATREQKLQQVVSVRKEREKWLENLQSEYSKYKKKAETVAKLQKQQGGGQDVDGSLLEKMQAENAELRSRITAVSAEIRSLQQSNGNHCENVARIRGEILALCDALAQKQSQQAMFEKKRQALRAEIAEKEEEREMLDKFAVEQNAGRKKALDQEVDILRTLQKNLEVEMRGLQQKLEVLVAEGKVELERMTRAQTGVPMGKGGGGHVPSGDGEKGDRATLTEPAAGAAVGNGTLPQHQDHDPLAFEPPPRHNSTASSFTSETTSATELHLHSSSSRQPSVAWSDLMELRGLIRQYEQCIEQEKRDEELLKQQNDHLIAQLQEVYSCTNLKQNIGERTQVEYIRNVFRSFLAETEPVTSLEHEQCIPVLLKFLEFDVVEQEQIRARRAEMKGGGGGVYEAAAREGARVLGEGVSRLRGWMKW
eukprot:g4380.t1